MAEKMKVSINRKIVQGPWGGGNLFVKGLESSLKKRGHTVFYDLVDDLDYIFIINPVASNYGYPINDIVSYKNHFPNVKIIHRINECEKRKNLNNGMDRLLIDTANFSDQVFFISDWLKEYFYEKGYKGKSDVVYNGCDTSIFKNNLNRKEINSVHLITHHWSNHELKGYDFYTELDRIIKNKGWDFTFIGRYCSKYNAHNIKLVEPKSGNMLAKELEKGNIYVTASKWEPCGMHHIEAAACGLPILYHEDGGGINEGCKRYGRSFKDIESFEKQLINIVDNYQKYQEKLSNYDLSIDYCCEKYLEKIGI
jgi:glycosyltransferase involved in cell wall biosynthesis